MLSSLIIILNQLSGNCDMSVGKHILQLFMGPSSWAPYISTRVISLRPGASY